MTKQNIFIDDIYWERVQLFVKGHFEGVNLQEISFLEI